MSPPTVGGKDGETEAILEVAKFMVVAAGTALKTVGIDDILTSVVYGSEKDTLANEMEKKSLKNALRKHSGEAQKMSKVLM